MKKFIPMLIGGITLAASNSYALEFSAVSETELTMSEKTAFENATSLAREISSGKNESAMEEASIECPNDNNPTFVVDRIESNTFWLETSTQVSDKRYSGEIHYTIKCAFTHGKQR